MKAGYFYFRVGPEPDNVDDPLTTSVEWNPQLASPLTLQVYRYLGGLGSGIL